MWSNALKSWIASKAGLRLLRRATECSRYCNLLERSSRNDEKNEEIASASYGVQRYCKLKKSSSRNDEKKRGDCFDELRSAAVL